MLPPRLDVPLVCGNPYFELNEAGELVERRQPNGDLTALIDKMLASSGEAQAHLARSILQVDLENVDAYVVLAKHAETKAEAMAFLREAVRIGEHIWLPLVERNFPVEWWRDTRTRPYMRALMAYANALAEAGLEREAVECYIILQKLDPEDPLGANAEMWKYLRGPESASN